MIPLSHQSGLVAGKDGGLYRHSRPTSSSVTSVGDGQRRGERAIPPLMSLSLFVALPGAQRAHVTGCYG